MNTLTALCRQPVAESETIEFKVCITQSDDVIRLCYTD